LKETPAGVNKNNEGLASHKYVRANQEAPHGQIVLLVALSATATLQP
jgi:hypothetical protein